MLGYKLHRNLFIPFFSHQNCINTIYKFYYRNKKYIMPKEIEKGLYPRELQLKY